MHSRLPSIIFAASLATLAMPVAAQSAATPPGAPAGPSYAALATLADDAPLVVRARVKNQAVVPAERAPGVKPGHVRLYIEAQTTALIAGRTALPASLRYLADVPLDAKGKPPKLKKQEVILFARPVAGRAGELQLTQPNAQLAWTAALEERLRPIVVGFVAPDAPPRVTGVRDVLSSVGNLAGESETQIFLTTVRGEPAALTVVRRPGMAPRWGVSWTELVDQAAQPAQRDTIAWYRLACSLPASLPRGANVASDPADQARAEQDYRYVIEQLGPCNRD